MTALEWWTARFLKLGRKSLEVSIYHPDEYHSEIEHHTLFLENTNWAALQLMADSREIAMRSLDKPCHWTMIDFRGHEDLPRRAALLKTILPHQSFTFFDSGRSFHAYGDTIPIDGLNKYLDILKANCERYKLGVDVGWIEACRNDEQMFLRLTRNDEERFLKVPELIVP